MGSDLWQAWPSGQDSAYDPLSSGGDQLPHDGPHIEWAVIDGDGNIRPKHPNETVIGTPTAPPMHAHRGERWIRRTVYYSRWEPWPRPRSRPWPDVPPRDAQARVDRMQADGADHTRVQRP